MSTEFVKLGDAAEFINGVAFKPVDWGDEGKKIIRIQNLNSGSKKFNRTFRIVDDKYVVRPGDLLVSWSATLGVYEWNDLEDGLVNQHIFRVLPGKNTDKSYLKHCLKNALASMDSHLHGATMKHINRGEFLATKIPLPSIVDQRRIAGILDRAEELRAKRRAAITLLDQLPQAMFLEMFGDRDSVGRNWPNANLGDQLEFLTSGSRGWAKYYADEGKLFLRIQNVRKDELDLKDVAYVVPPKTQEAKRTRVKVGDVLISITADLGRSAVIDHRVTEGYINQHLAILRPGKLIVGKYLSAYIACEAGQIQIQGKNRQGVKAGLNFEDIRTIRIPMPPIELQGEFATRVEAIHRAKAAHQSALAELDALFTSLQSKAFEGVLNAKGRTESITAKSISKSTPNETTLVDKLHESYKNMNTEALEAAQKAIRFRGLADIGRINEALEDATKLSTMLAKQTEFSRLLPRSIQPAQFSVLNDLLDTTSAVSGFQKMIQESLLPSTQLSGLLAQVSASQMVGMDKTIESIRRLTVANSLDTSVAQIMAGFVQHHNVFESITSSWRNSILEDLQKTSLLFEELQTMSLPTQVLELGSIERFNAVRLLQSTISKSVEEDEPETGTAIEIVRTQYLDSVEAGLEAIDPRILKMYQGAKQAAKSKNLDRSRHVAVSLREMTTHLLHTLATNEDIAQWSTSANDYANGKPTRACRIRFIYSRYGPEVLDFFEGDIREAIKWIDRINGETHTLDGFETDGAVEALITRFEGIALSLIRGAKGFE